MRRVVVTGIGIVSCIGNGKMLADGKLIYEATDLKVGCSITREHFKNYFYRKTRRREDKGIRHKVYKV